MTIPPLRERREDIPLLINHFTERYCRPIRKRINGYTIKAYTALQAYEWEGNVRELENEIRSLVNLAEDGDAIGFELLSDSIKGAVGSTDRPPVVIVPKADPQTEIQMLTRLLAQNGWNKSETARQLNMTYRGLHEKMKRLGIRRPNHTD